MTKSLNLIVSPPVDTGEHWAYKLYGITESPPSETYMIIDKESGLIIFHPIINDKPENKERS